MYSMGEAALIPRKIHVVLLGALICSAAAADDAVQSVLALHCFACHNDKLKTANLSLEHPGLAPSVWEKIIDKLSSGRMPPPGSPAPSKADVALVTAWIEKHLGPA